MKKYEESICAIDQAIGHKIYKARLSAGLSRRDLSLKINVTHQQLQKYEKGVNRIGVGRLVLLSNALQKDPKYFYEDFLTENAIEESTIKTQRLSLELFKNFAKIQKEKHKVAIANLIKVLSSECKEADDIEDL
jgi:transcriptional regulator with XRE-family HTH domain